MLSAGLREGGKMGSNMQFHSVDPVPWLALDFMLHHLLDKLIGADDFTRRKRKYSRGDA